MKNKKTFLEKISSGKGFYITAGVSVASVVVAILVLYATTVQISEEYIEYTNITELATEQAEGNVTDEEDPRYSDEDSSEDDNESEDDDINDEETTQSETTTTTQVATTQTEEVVATPVNTSYILPIDTTIIKDYSMDTLIYSETMGDWRVHTGIDFYASESDYILSVGNGVVTKVSAESSWGYVIEVDYGDFVARYCGMKQGTTVSIGTVLEQGDIVGCIDSCPCEALDESHLHFEVLVDDEYVDPLVALGLE